MYIKARYPEQKLAAARSLTNAEHSTRIYRLWEKNPWMGEEQ